MKIIERESDKWKIGAGAFAFNLPFCILQTIGFINERTTYNFLLMIVLISFEAFVIWVAIIAYKSQQNMKKEK